MTFIRSGCVVCLENTYNLIVHSFEYVSKPLSGLGCRSFYGGGYVVVDSLFIVAHIVCGVMCLFFNVLCSPFYSIAGLVQKIHAFNDASCLSGHIL